MSSCTIRDLLRLALPFGSRLLTSESGLRHHIEHAVGLRATVPIFPSLRGGELVLLSLDEARAIDERLTLPRLVERLLEVPVGAIAVVGVVEDSAVAQAARADLPLLQMGDDMNVRQVERDVLYLLHNRELQIERRAAQLYSALTQQIALGHDMINLLRTVGEATGRPVAFFNATGDLGAQWCERSIPECAFVGIHPEDLAGGKRNGHPYLVRTVGTATSPRGYIALGGASFDSWDASAAEQAAAALLLELAKQQAVQAVATRAGGDLLSSIVSGASVDMTVLQQQAAELGYDLRRPHVALMIASASDAVTMDDIDDQLGRLLGARQIAAPHAVRDEAVVCLLPTDEPARRPPVLLQELAASLPIAAGISTPAPTASAWQRAYTEAQQALLLGRHLFGPRSIVLYADLRIARLLVALRGSPELWTFYQTTLGALVDYDRRHHAALLKTLEGYFAAGGNLSQASEHLLIHRNTLLYRLRRISQISGADLDRPDDMLALQVALMAHRVLASSYGEGQRRAPMDDQPRLVER